MYNNNSTLKFDAASWKLRTHKRDASFLFTIATGGTCSLFDIPGEIRETVVHPISPPLLNDAVRHGVLRKKEEKTRYTASCTFCTSSTYRIAVGNTCRHSHFLAEATAQESRRSAVTCISVNPSISHLPPKFPCRRFFNLVKRPGVLQFQAQ